jgi:DNA-binding NarL/FixJ family response regulator
MEEMGFHDSNRGQTGKIRILVVDQYPLFRQALRAGIEKEQDFEVVAEACDGKESTALVARLHPDIVIISTDIPGPSGLGATRRIKKIYPDTRVLLLTPAAYRVNLPDFIASGASGYQEKKAPIEGMIHALRAVITDDSVFFQPPTQAVLQRGQAVRSEENHVIITTDRLSGREITMLQYIAGGMSNKEIAHRMELSLSTVKIHISNILVKLHASSRTEAVTNGLRYGILTLGEVGK